MLKLFNKRMDITMNIDSFKVFQKYLDTRHNLNFDNFIPSIEFNEKSIMEKVITKYSEILREDVKFKPSHETLLPWNEKEKIKMAPVIQVQEEAPQEPVFDASKLGLPTQPIYKKLDDGMILMNLAIPKNLVSSKRTSRSMTRRSIASLINKDKKEPENFEIPEALQAVFNLPFMIPQLQEAKSKAKTNELKMVLKLGNKPIKEGIEHIDVVIEWLNDAQMSFFNNKDLQNLELNRVNDNLNMRSDIMKRVFPDIPFMKRYNLVLSLNR